MKRTLSVYIVIIVVLLLEGCFFRLFAGQVTLEISTTTAVSRNNVNALYRIRNRGTDTAREISVLARFQDEQQDVFIAEQLAPGQTAEGGTDFNLPENLQGSFPLFVTVYYEHADGIRVSSVSLASVNVGAQGEKGLEAEADFKDGEAAILLESWNRPVERVTITPHGPADLLIDPPAQSVQIENGIGRAKFRISNISGKEGSVYGVFFAAEYDLEGRHGLAVSDVAVPVEKLPATISPGVERLQTTLYTALSILAAILLAGVIISSRLRQYLFSLRSIPCLLDISVLAAAEVFIFARIDLPSLFTATITTGGDTASHYYTLEYLRHTLLPAGKISGWTMGNYAGFPILQFYFPLSFLIMSLLDLVMPLQVAFKLVTLLGTASLPMAAYVLLRLLRCPFPGPGIGSLLMLPFLFNSANSMWGGNILSTLAGEFSYSLSMSLSLILIGSLYRGARENKWAVRNGILVFLVGFSHGYTLLFAEAVSLFLLITPYGFTKRAIYLFKVYAFGFCLLAFWLVPLLVFTQYTTSYHLVWTIHSFREIIPEILLPVAVAGLGGSVILLVAGIIRFGSEGRGILVQLAYLWFGLGVAVVFFVAAPKLGVVDIRYVPYGQLMVCMMAALFLGWAARGLLNRWGLNLVLLIVVGAGILVWTGDRVGPVKEWSKWNYEGFEAKKTWPLFTRINKSLAGDFQDPRVVFEHSQDHNMFGASRAFESLPLFAGRATLEGLYMQASITAPFVFYIQSMISSESSQPFPQYSYTRMDYERARDYLKLFNVRQLILKSSQAKQAVRQVQGYDRVNSFGQYEIWEVSDNRDRYVEVLGVEPVVYSGKEPWKQVAHQWFSRGKEKDVPLVFNVPPEEYGRDGTGLNFSADSLDKLDRLEIDISGCRVMEDIRDQEILLETNCPGKPHIVKVSYHPDWHVEGAAGIHLVSPSFMLIYPLQEKVRLFYGPGPWDRLGQMFTLFGLFVLLLNVPLPGKSGQTAWTAVSARMNLPADKVLRFLPDPGPGIRRITVLVILAVALICVAAVSYRTYVYEPHRGYNRSIQYKDAGQYEKARTGFRKYLEAYPLSSLAQEAAYYIGITYYLEKNDSGAIRAFEDYLARYPRGHRAAEINYHIGLVLLRSGRKEEGVNRMRQLIENYPGSSWAKYGADRLQEQGVSLSGELINIESSNLNEYMARAIGFFNQDRLSDAKPIFLQISERFPGFSGAPQALAALALCYYKENDCANTIKHYQKLVERYPEHGLVAEAYFHLGLCYERTGSYGRAAEAYEKVLEIDPDGVYGKQARGNLPNKVVPKD